MNRISVLFLQFCGWLSSLGKIVPPVLDGTEAAAKIHDQFFAAQLDMLDHAALAEYHGAMQEMLYYRRKRLNEDPFMKGYFEPEEELPGAIPLPPPKKEKLH